MNVALVFVIIALCISAGLLLLTFWKPQTNPSNDEDEDVPEPNPNRDIIDDKKEIEKSQKKCLDLDTHRPLANSGTMCHFLSLMHLFGTIMDFGDSAKVQKYFSPQMFSAVRHVAQPLTSTKTDEDNFGAIARVCLNKGMQESPVNDIDNLYIDKYLRELIKFEVLKWKDHVVIDDCKDHTKQLYKYIVLNFPNQVSIEGLFKAFMHQDLLPNNVCDIQESRFTEMLADKFLILEYPRGDLNHKKITSKVFVNQFIHSDDGTAFQLLACVMHFGDKISSGHYMCATMHPSGKWVLYNDSAVTCYTSFKQLVDDKSVHINRNGILFLYKLL
jgi:hypothetical protein